MTVSILGQIKGTVVDSSNIIIVNNIRFSVIKYHDNDNMDIRFRSEHNKGGGLINGFIEYKKTDESEANQYLQDLLRSMHFKN